MKIVGPSGMLVALLSSFTISFSANALTLIEDFENSFPAWESGWLGLNSNLQNDGGVGSGRGNNPDGLWINDGDGIKNGSDDVEIVFDSIFGLSLTSLSLDIAAFADDLSIEIYDSVGAIILSSAVTQTNGAFVDPGIYESFSVSSTNGISGFTLISSGTPFPSQIEGNTSIDNVVVTTSTVPIPAGAWLFISGLLGLLGVSRRA